ncbi:hypothetical protein [Oceanidesulfovibrio marinus]|uniref:hypothetical protein n=1 Tax=Oceanidesulfovibrio marinus TaxID=370038 RepID=UPI001184B16F|nr:hypothetical protein [Oceanidesulfovibrio marinus]
MMPRIIVHSNLVYSIVTKHRIGRFLNKVALDDVAGLDKIVATLASGKKKRNGVLGEYVYGEKMIVLYLNQIYADKQYIMLLPVVGALMLADTFYHEVGNHTLSSLHSIKKSRQEIYANRYAGKLLNQTFPIVFYVLRRVFAKSKM